MALLLFVFLAWAPAAYAWSWPLQGPVVQPFTYDEAHPYAAGQHRGIDIGADAAGETAVAPAAGTVAFAGSVAANGLSVTIETADGYSVTLTHLGSILVSKGATVAEQDAIGTVGPSGTPEVDGPYVHLGIRLTTDPNGYVDPLGLLPPASVSTPSDTGSTVPQPSSDHVSSPAAANKPAARAPRSPQAKATRLPAREEARAQAAHADSRPLRSAGRADSSRSRTPQERPQPRAHPSERTSSIRRPFAEPEAAKPSGLDVGHRIRGTVPVAQPVRGPSDALPGLVCNWLAALVAVGAALVAGRRRRRLDPGASVLHLPRPTVDRRRISRAA